MWLNTPQAGQPIDSPVEAADADGDPLQYALSGTDGNLFDINRSSGQLLTRAALDYEVANEYEVDVSVSDGKDTNAVSDDDKVDDSVRVTIEVTNVDEPGSVSLFPSQLRVRTVVRATLSDPDGVDVHAVSWQWATSSDGVSWTPVPAPGGTQADYAPTDIVQGQYLRATASYTDGQGTGKRAEVVSDNVVGERESGPELTVVSLVSGLRVPWGLAFAPDGTMLFTERGDRLSSRLTDGTVQSVSADFDDLLVSGEAGLMAIVVDPAFASNRRFYTCQAHTGRVVQVIAWTFNDDTYTAATRVADPLVGNIPAASRHSGCRLRFGPQGYLWIATGDATVGTAPQDLNSLGGKVLRVDAATGAAAAGNPFGSRIYTYGHRNVQGLARRPGTDQMWSVEHGPRVDDEINLLSAGGNYGWDPVPGYDEGVPMTDLAKFPGALVARWSSGNPTLATSGGIFLEGAQWGRWDGRLAVASLKDQTLRVFRFTDAGAFVSQVVVPELDGRYGRLRTPLLGPDGALYVTTSNGSGDRILKVVPGQAPRFPDTEDGARRVAEHTAPGTAIGQPVVASDPDGDRLTYALSGAAAAAFDIVPSTGHVQTAASLDHETRPAYEGIVTATDQYGLNDRLTVSITVTDAPGTVTLSSNQPSNQPQVGRALTATLTDPDGVDEDESMEWCWERSRRRAFLSADPGTRKIDCDANATATYTPVNGDRAHYLRATVAYTDGDGTFKKGVSVTSAESVTAPGSPRPLPSPPSPPGPPGGGPPSGGPPAEERPAPVGYLENPGDGSFQSGIGLISGWVCEAESVEIEIETVGGEVLRLEAAYGTARLDTARRPDGTPLCGDTDNGFGLLFNWNLLGDGEHEIVALVDGVELGRATVTVTTLGTEAEAEFLRGAEGACVVEDFPLPGETVTLEWQESRQNFVIASGTRPAGESRAGIAGVGRLENPGRNSFQSGIGLISGWVCDADTVEIAIGAAGRQAAAYGTERLDTRDTCGDTDNGFGLLFNWNLLGDGEHEVVAYVDEAELGRAVVRVTTLGAEFVEGAAGACVVDDFPLLGETVTVEWQQTSQNFVITDVE